MMFGVFLWGHCLLHGFSVPVVPLTERTTPSAILRVAQRGRVVAFGALALFRARG